MGRLNCISGKKHYIRPCSPDVPKDVFMSPQLPTQTKNAVLLIADISGYTEFIVMKKVSAIHAEEVITELLESIANAAKFPLKLNKIEGDALFFCADSDGDTRAAVNDVARQAAQFMRSFHEQQKTLILDGDGGCPCSACRGVGKLGLKILIHADDIVLKQIAGQSELAGAGVILIHRLLKNSIRANSYILFPESTAALLDHKPFEKQKTIVEKVRDFGNVKLDVYFPDPVSLPHTHKPPLTSLKGLKETLRLFLRHLSGRKQRLGL